MVLQSAAHRVFSRPTRYFERFADNSYIPWDQPTTFHPNRIADVTQRFLLSLCAPLPALQHHVSQNDDALMYNDSRIDLHLPKSIDFLERSPSGWLSGREMFEDSFPFPVKFLFCKDEPVTVEKPILYHNGIPVIVPRFTFHCENFAIRCDQDTDFSVRGTWLLVHFLHGAIVILVLLHTSQFRSFARPLVVEVWDEAARESCLLALPVRWKLLHPPNCQRTPPNHSGRSCNRSSCASSLSLFFFVFVWVLLKVFSGLSAFTPSSCLCWLGCGIIPF